MIKVKRQQPQKFAKFLMTPGPYIESHRILDGKVEFDYVFPISIDQSLIGQIQGDLQIRIFKIAPRKPAISVKKSDIAGSNIIKKVDQQRSEQVASRKYEKKYFSKKFIDRPDLIRSSINFEYTISSQFIGSESFSVEIAAVRLDGSSTTIDTLDVNHQRALQAYDLPSGEFELTATRNSSGIITVAATSNDPTTGGFDFFYRSDSSTDFRPISFTGNQRSPLDYGNTSTVQFDARESDFSYTIRSIPVSRFLSQKIGNFKEQKLEFAKSDRYIPVYLSELSDESVKFSSFPVDETVKKVFLYRELLATGERSFVDSTSIADGSNISLEDTGRISQYDFKYTIEYTNEQGEKKSSPTEIIVPGLKLDKLASISVTRSEKSRSDFNVSVDYNTSTIYDEIITDLTSLGLKDLFSTDIEKMTNNLRPITRVLVSRISHRSGIVEDVGVYPTGSITLKDSGSSDDLYTYRFEVAVRSVPESLEMLASGKNILANNAFNLGSITDLATKLIGNSYSTATSFSSKFFTKSSMKGSTIRAGDSLSLSDISYYAGRTGIFADVSPVRRQPPNTNIITNIRTIRAQKGNYVTWSFSNSQSSISYFMIELEGEKFMSLPTSDARQRFFIGNRDASKIVITPVFSDSNRSIAI